MGILSDINRARKKATKKILNPVVKGVSKVTDKLLPNELRFLAPYAAGIGTLMLPPGMSPLIRALSAAGLNTLGQIAADETPIEDISDLNALSVALAGGVGALGSDQVSGAMRGGIEAGGAGTTAREAAIMSQSGVQPPPVGFLQGAENVAREGIAGLSDYVTGSRETLAGFGRNPGKLFSTAGATEAAKALGPTLSQATGDVAYETAIDAQNEFDRIQEEELRQAGMDEAAISNARRSAIREAMEVSGFTEEDILETFDEIGLKDGGRVGYARGKLVKEGLGALKLFRRPKYRFEDEAKMTLDLTKTGRYTEKQLLELDGDQIAEIYEYEGFTPPAPIEGSTKIIDMEEIMENIKNITPEDKADGGITGLKDGGMLDFGGREMDLRGGGFVPIGKKEKADDVPARLSKNEFVMTADAVRAAGGGSVNKGAQRMYNLMNSLEARA